MLLSVPPPSLGVSNPKTEEEKLFNYLLTFEDRLLAKQFRTFIRELKTEKNLDTSKVEKDAGCFEQQYLEDLMVTAFKKSSVSAYLQHSTAKKLKTMHSSPKWLKGCFHQTSLDPYASNLACPELFETLFDEAYFLLGTLQEFTAGCVTKEERKKAAVKYGHQLYCTMCQLFPHSVFYLSFRFILRLQMKEIIRHATQGQVKYNLTSYTHAPKCLCFRWCL